MNAKQLSERLGDLFVGFFGVILFLAAGAFLINGAIRIWQTGLPEAQAMVIIIALCFGLVAYGGARA
jgi:hypothetical protein